MCHISIVSITAIPIWKDNKKKCIRMACSVTPGRLPQRKSNLPWNPLVTITLVGNPHIRRNEYYSNGAIINFISQFIPDCIFG